MSLFGGLGPILRVLALYVERAVREAGYETIYDCEPTQHQMKARREQENVSMSVYLWAG